MKFKKVEKVPEVLVRVNNKLRHDWQEFMDMNVKIAEVDLTQYNYKSVIVARSVMGASIKRFGFPIDIFRRGDKIYLVRRDM